MRLCVLYKAVGIASAWSLLMVPLFAQDEPVAPPQIDVLNYSIQAEVEPNRSYLTGKTQVEFVVLEETLAIPFTLNRNLTVLQVTDDEKNYFSIRADNYSENRFRVQTDDLFEAGATYRLNFEYEGLLEPEQYAFLDLPSEQKAVIDQNGAQLFSEGYWFPSYRLPVDTAQVTARVTVPLGFSVVAPGILESIDTLGLTEAFNWKTTAEVGFVPAIIARFYRNVEETDNLKLTYFVEEDFEKDLGPLSGAIQEIFDFYRSVYGEPVVDELVLAQVGNKILASTGSTGLIFLESKVLDAYNIPLAELARRVAEQWWGFSVRMKRSQDAWIKDGFAHFAALKFLQEKRADQYEIELSKEAIEALKYQDTAPIAGGLDLEIGSPRYRSIVGAKGAWILYMLGQLITAEKLDAAIVRFYEEFRGKPASIGDFAELIEKITGENYNWFFVQWIESVGVPEFRLDYSIYKLLDGTFKIRGQIKQNLELFRMPMEVLIHTKGNPEEKTMRVSGKNTSFTFMTQTMPIRIELDPKGKILRDSEKMRIAVHIALGDEFKTAGEYISAMDEYESAIELNARSSLAHFRLGEVYFEQHSYSNAANSMRAALNGDLQPDWVETWCHIYLGKVYDILGQRQRAKAEYRKAINSKIDYNGAQAEAKKYFDEPFTKPSNVLD